MGHGAWGMWEIDLVSLSVYGNAGSDRWMLMCGGSWPQTTHTHTRAYETHVADVGDEKWHLCIIIMMGIFADNNFSSSIFSRSFRFLSLFLSHTWLLLFCRRFDSIDWFWLPFAHARSSVSLHLLLALRSVFAVCVFSLLINSGIDWHFRSVFHGKHFINSMWNAIWCLRNSLASNHHYHKHSYSTF